MPNYKKMYTTLFNAITDAIVGLQAAQRETEEAYIAADDAPIHLAPQDDPD